MSGNSNGQKPEVDAACLEIDDLALDKEWVKQPSLFFKWARRLAKARSDEDEAKAEFDLTKAEVESNIRENAIQFELHKVTDASVEAKVKQQGVYIKAQADLYEARRRVGLYEAMVKALDHRKRALEKLVDLTTMNYYSTPRAPENAREAMDEIDKRAARTKKKRRREPPDDE